MCMTTLRPDDRCEPVACWLELVMGIRVWPRTIDRGGWSSSGWSSSGAYAQSGAADLPRRVPAEVKVAWQGYHHKAAARNLSLRALIASEDGESRRMHEPFSLLIPVYG